MDDTKAERNLFGGQLWDLLVETEDDNILLEYIQPSELFIKQALEVHRMHPCDDRGLPDSAEVVGDVTDHKEEEFLLAEMGEGFVEIETMQFIIVLQLSEIVDFVSILLAAPEFLLEKGDFLGPEVGGCLERVPLPKPDSLDNWGEHN